jgi:ribonuclease P protein component
MLAKKRRVKTKEFNSAFSGTGAKSCTSTFFSFKVVQGPKTEEKTVFSCVVSKKVANTAVLRNKTRRRVYEAIKKVLPTVKNGYICLVFVKKEAIKADFSDIVKDIAGLMKKGGII